MWDGMSFSESLKPAILGIDARTSREDVTDPSRWAIAVYRDHGGRLGTDRSRHRCDCVCSALFTN